MQQALILYPPFALVILTFGIALWMLRLRFRAVRNRELNPKYFRLNRGGKEPEQLAQVTQNYDNLLEMPILFYAVCIASLAAQQVDTVLLSLAWVYVGARLIHSYIHTTYNYLLHRMSVFLFSTACLAAMWIYLAIKALP